MTIATLNDPQAGLRPTHVPFVARRESRTEHRGQRDRTAAATGHGNPIRPAKNDDRFLTALDDLFASGETIWK